MSAVLKSLTNVTRKAVRDVSFDSIKGPTVKAIAADIQREAQLGTWGRWRRMAPRYPEIWRVLRWSLGGSMVTAMAGAKREAEAADARDTAASIEATAEQSRERDAYRRSQPPPATPELLDMWAEVLAGMEERIGAADVAIWLRKLHPVVLEGGVLTLQVLTKYYSQHIDESYRGELEAELTAARGAPTAVAFVLRGGS